MHALIDGDIIRYEVGFAAEVGWKNNDLPPWQYVEDMLLERIQRILHGAGATTYTLYVTEGKTFRYDIATVKPYKGNRKADKPWHFNNISVYLKDVLGAVVVRDIEADDAMAIEQTGVEHLREGCPEVAPTIICTRDKDLRQVPGWHYGWEMGAQPSFGPEFVLWDDANLELNDKRNAIKGTGLAFFYAQVLWGDRADNIPGLPGCGAVAAYEALKADNDGLYTVSNMYQEHYGGEWEERLLEQGQLCWMSRRLHPDGKPVLWELDMTE